MLRAQSNYRATGNANMPLRNIEVLPEATISTSKKEVLCNPSLAAYTKERPFVLKGRAPPHRPRGRASTQVYPSKKLQIAVVLAINMPWVAAALEL
eukprot:1151834-Pelagomonas_calceolata.AAC.2